MAQVKKEVQQRDEHRDKLKEIQTIIFVADKNQKFEKGRLLGKEGSANCYELKDMATKQTWTGKIVSKSMLSKSVQKENIAQEIEIRENKIIHRDLKPENLFLNDDVELKIGDFGLATQLEKDGEREKTLCGTPDYIAPEILTKKRHSYEVDSWSLRCILCLIYTYSLIQRCKYHIDRSVSLPARTLITKLLRAYPRMRLTMAEVLADSFITEGPLLPRRLPTSCLTTQPRSEDASIWQSVSMTDARKPLAEINKGTDIRTKLLAVEKDVKKESYNVGPDGSPINYYISDLYDLLSSVIGSHPADKLLVCEEDVEDPASVPVYWVSTWWNNTNNYGLGYQLCDNSVGVFFNDNTHIILLNDNSNIHYIEKDGTEHYHTLTQFPETMQKKVTLLYFFKGYMNEHLLKAGEAIPVRDRDEIIRLPYLRVWFRTKRAIVMHLSNGTLQLNFIDHTKVILCPLMEAVTYINEKKEFRTFKLKSLIRFGCSKELYSRLRYAKAMAEKILNLKLGEKIA